MFKKTIGFILAFLGVIFVIMGIIYRDSLYLVLALFWLITGGFFFFGISSSNKISETDEQIEESKNNVNPSDYITQKEKDKIIKEYLEGIKSQNGTSKSDD